MGSRGRTMHPNSFLEMTGKTIQHDEEKKNDFISFIFLKCIFNVSCFVLILNAPTRYVNNMAPIFTL